MSKKNARKPKDSKHQRLIFKEREAREKKQAKFAKKARAGTAMDTVAVPKLLAKSVTKAIKMSD